MDKIDKIGNWAQLSEGGHTITTTPNDLTASLGDHATWTKEMWWIYANSRFTDNYAMNAILSKSKEDRDFRGTHAGLERVKSLLARLTLLLDAACLDEGMSEAGKLLGFEQDGGFKNKKHHHHASVQSRLDHGNTTLWK